MIEPDTLDRLESAAIVDAHGAALTALEEPRAEGTRRAVRAALRVLEHNGLIAIVDPADWPEWLEGDPGTP